MRACRRGWASTPARPWSARWAAPTGPTRRSSAAPRTSRSRLEAIAAPGSVVISDATGRLIDERFRLADRGVPPLKGVSQQIHAFEVVGVDVLTAHTPTEPGTPLVGRRDELATLCERFEKVRTGEGQTVVVLRRARRRQVTPAAGALPGGGRQPARVARVPVLRAGHGQPPAAHRRDARAHPRDGPCHSGRPPRAPGEPPGTPGRAGSGLPSGTWASWSASPTTTAPPPKGPELRRARVLEALAEWPLALRRRPARGHRRRGRALVRPHVARAAPPRGRGGASPPPALRADPPHRCRGRPAPAQHHHRAAPARCCPRARSWCAASLATPSSRPTGSPPLARRGDGVPLFIEELVSSAREGAPTNGDTEVPPTLQGLLAARLDRLGPVRAVAQAASVLGREFPLALLDAVDHFNGAALLPSVVAAGTGRRADHPRRERRGRLHLPARPHPGRRLLRRCCGVSVGSCTPGSCGSSRSGSPAASMPPRSCSPTTSPPRARTCAAAEWYERAGRRAAVHAAFGEAVAHYRSGLACLEHAPEGRPRRERTLSLDILMANALMGSNGLGSADLLPIWERAIALADELGDQEELTSALNGAAVYHADHGDDDVAIAMAERIVAIADATGSRVAALRGNGTLGMTRFFRGEGERALAHTELALSLSREGDFESVTYGVGHDEGVFFHAMASWNLWWLGRPDAGLSRALEGSRQADALPSSLTQAMARHAVAMIRLLRGEGVHASVVAGENLRLTEEVGLPFWRGLALLVLGTELARRGDESGLGQLDLGLGLLLEEGNHGGASLGLALLADAELHLGRFEQAIATADAGLATSASLRPTLLRPRAAAPEGPRARRGARQPVAGGRPSSSRASPWPSSSGRGHGRSPRPPAWPCCSAGAAGAARGPRGAHRIPGRDGRRRRHRRPAASPCPARPAALGPLPHDRLVQPNPGRETPMPKAGSPVYLSGPMFSKADVARAGRDRPGAREGRFRHLPTPARRHRAGAGDGRHQRATAPCRRHDGRHALRPQAGLRGRRVPAARPLPRRWCSTSTVGCPTTAA